MGPVKFFFVTLGVILALILWVTAASVATVWVDATFGGDWKAIPVAIGVAPAVAGVFLFVVWGE